MDLDILYISCYPNEYFRQLVAVNKTLTSQPSQKFNKLFVNGFKLNNANISVLCTFNHLRWEGARLFIKKEHIIEDGVKYFFLPTLKIRYINYIYNRIIIKKFMADWRLKHPDGVIIMDCLKPYSYLVNKYAGYQKIVTIITDLPEHLMMNSKGYINKLVNKLRLHLYNKIIQRSNYFVFLTEQMNEKLNKENKPYCIIEGLVNINIELNNKSQINKVKTCLYSGALHKHLGIKNLVNAFTDEKLCQYELHLYGAEDYVSEIVKTTEKYSNIKYFGVVENEIVVQKQMEATVLINPRPTNQEFTKYSFPSKNMEYMASGTPVITTALAGMPSEYNEFVYILEDYSESGIVKCISKIMNYSDQDLLHKGKEARNFVLKFKNNVTQSKKIIEMIGKI